MFGGPAVAYTLHLTPDATALCSAMLSRQPYNIDCARWNDEAVERITRPEPQTGDSIARKYPKHGVLPTRVHAVPLAAGMCAKHFPGGHSGHLSVSMYSY